MLEDRTIEVWAYNLETVLAEKLETVVSRNVTNTRMRDFYDIYILQKLYGEQLQKQVLWTALVATAKKRGTLDLIEAEDIREIFDEIESSPVIDVYKRQIFIIRFKPHYLCNIRFIRAALVILAGKLE